MFSRAKRCSSDLTRPLELASLVQIVKRELPTREHVHVLKFHLVDCVTIHMTSLPVKITLFLLSRYRYAVQDNYRKVCSSSLDFCKKIAETVKLPLNGYSIFVLLMHYLFIPSTFSPEKSPEQPKHERGAKWARRKSVKKIMR